MASARASPPSLKKALSARSVGMGAVEAVGGEVGEVVVVLVVVVVVVVVDGITTCYYVTT